ncbi:MAG: inorganic phosphate transporter [Gammaproteobacteria bacterium]|nr:inorganic phosphate transporter [Gammaproteobacteria bacterium]MBQ0841069.1 inorganic phosphate transporter [Gammaproteobacteria bacterium]
MEAFNTSLIIVLLIVALFDFTNGFHDAADMVATAIASRSIKPGIAIAIVSSATFIAPLTIGLAVADTVGTFIDISGASALSGTSIIIGALLSAISYNLVTWFLGYPSSSSNSLAGGLVGAGLYGVGSEQIHWGYEALLDGRLEGLMKVVMGLFASPLLGFIIGFLTMKGFFVVFSRLTVKASRFFIVSQYFSIAWLGASHGANDAQKGMAIIGMMLLATGQTAQFTVPDWAVIWCASAITLGTLFGGWRIIQTLGFGLFRVKPIHSVANQMGSALVNSIATAIGAPTSTSQVVTATLLGNGAAEKPGHVKWHTAAGIISGWWLNLPISFFLGWFYCFILTNIRA